MAHQQHAVKIFIAKQKALKRANVVAFKVALDDQSHFLDWMEIVKMCFFELSKNNNGSPLAEHWACNAAAALLDGFLCSLRS